MNKIFLLIIVLLIAVILNSCSKKSHPSRTPSVTVITDNSLPEATRNDSLVTKNDSSVTKEEVIKRKPKRVFPKVITVNDSAAHKSVDGRYYYDVMGHRYWRNNKDGKYYLFDKSMYKNDAFKKPD